MAAKEVAFHLDIPLEQLLPRSKAEAHHFAAGLQGCLEILAQIVEHEGLDASYVQQTLKQTQQLSRKVDRLFIDLADEVDAR
tara:strand:- start:2741 stop:2986 length:246 start_codon:yes stop_codon:yes gene_type:complete